MHTDYGNNIDYTCYYPHAQKGFAVFYHIYNELSYVRINTS